ncbi:MAG: STAS domain-containing protein [Cytophagaceae bacterium]|nr:STAS domain-containing protein [Cytophagaceae bacterium]MDW8455249.1 STAS domain-containing protein [Cytophagaceae bacterium]
MNFTHTSSEDIVFIRFSGDLLGDTSGIKVADVANDYINDNKLYCAVDISAVKFMNSAGLGVLIMLLTKFRNKNGELILINPSEHIKKLLIITKLHSIFTIVGSDEEAKEYFKNIPK